MKSGVHYRAKSQRSARDKHDGRHLHSSLADGTTLHVIQYIHRNEFRFEKPIQSGTRNRTRIMRESPFQIQDQGGGSQLALKNYYGPTISN